MSIHEYETADGRRWRVRWRDGEAKLRSRSFTSHREAEAFDVEVRSRKLRGATLPQPGRTTLSGVWDDWKRGVAHSLAKNTVLSYEALWRAHIKPDLGDRYLAELVSNPRLFDEFIATMNDNGVGPEAQRKSMMVVSALLTYAVSNNLLASNPLWHRKKPLPKRRRRAPRPLEPIAIERIRREILRRNVVRDPWKREGDALIVSLLAYAGLRPQEALALKWDDIGEHTIIVDKATSFGAETQTKTGAARDAVLIAPLKEDLAAWRKTLKDPPGSSWVFKGRSDEGLWTSSAWRNWRARVWKPAVEQVADGDPNLEPLTEARPYDLRGSCVSLRLRAGEPPLEVARTTGHSPQVMFQHYAAVIEELRGQPPIAAEDQVERARRLVSEQDDDLVRNLVGESLKAPGSAPTEAKRRAQDLLYGPRRSRPPKNAS